MKRQPDVKKTNLPESLPFTFLCCWEAEPLGPADTSCLSPCTASDWFKHPGSLPDHEIIVHQPYNSWLVVWNMNFIFPYIKGIIIPIDFHIFLRGGPTTNHTIVLLDDVPMLYSWWPIELHQTSLNASSIGEIVVVSTMFCFYVVFSLAPKIFPPSQSNR